MAMVSPLITQREKEKIGYNGIYVRGNRFVARFISGPPPAVGEELTYIDILGVRYKIRIVAYDDRKPDKYIAGLYLETLSRDQNWVLPTHCI